MCVLNILVDCNRLMQPIASASDVSNADLFKEPPKSSPQEDSEDDTGVSAVILCEKGENI